MPTSEISVPKSFSFPGFSSSLKTHPLSEGRASCVRVRSSALHVCVSLGNSMTLCMCCALFHGLVVFLAWISRAFAAISSCHFSSSSREFNRVRKEELKSHSPWIITSPLSPARQDKLVLESSSIYGCLSSVYVPLAFCSNTGYNYPS